MTESPFVLDRALSIYTMHQACFEQRFYDGSYWARYFGMPHAPIATADASRPLTVRASVTDPSGVKWVRLRYRSVSQYFDYKNIAMEESDPGEYQATVPAADVAPEWDFMYFIELTDNAGNGKIHPDLEETAPYVIVRLER